MWKEHCKITIHGSPVPKSLLNNGRQIVNSPQTKRAMVRRISFIAMHIAKNGLRTIESKPIALKILYIHERPKRMTGKNVPTGRFYKTTKPDIDNLTKLLLDCCTQSNLWNDDCQVVVTELHDLYGAIDESPKTVIIVQTGDKYELPKDIDNP